MFGGLCKYKFNQCLLNWNDYETELVLEEGLSWYLWAAEHVAFPVQWKILAGMRGLKERHVS